MLISSQLKLFSVYTMHSLLNKVNSEPSPVIYVDTFIFVFLCLSVTNICIPLTFVLLALLDLLDLGLYKVNVF